MRERAAANIDFDTNAAPSAVDELSNVGVESQSIWGLKLCELFHKYVLVLGFSAEI